MVAHVFYPSTQDTEARQVDICEFQASLVHKGSPRTARAVTEKPCLEKTRNKTKDYKLKDQGHGIERQYLPNIINQILGFNHPHHHPQHLRLHYTNNPRNWHPVTKSK